MTNICQWKNYLCRSDICKIVYRATLRKSFYFTDKRRRLDSTSNVYNDPYSSSSGDDLPTLTTSKKGGVTFTESNHHRSRPNLTNIKPKPSRQDMLTLTSGKSRVETRSSTNHGLMSPFRTFGLSDGDSLFDNDPSSWSDISLDKTSTGRGITLSKLTSPGTTGESCIM